MMMAKKDEKEVFFLEFGMGSFLWNSNLDDESWKF
jgi:hypothetical protein